MKLRQSLPSLMYWGFGLCAPGVGCELDAEAVGKFSLEGVPVGEVAHELGLHPVPILGHSG